MVAVKSLASASQGHWDSCPDLLPVDHPASRDSIPLHARREGLGDA